MLAYVLNAMGDDLTAVVGAQVPQVLLFPSAMEDVKFRAYLIAKLKMIEKTTIFSFLLQEQLIYL